MTGTCGLSRRTYGQCRPGVALETALGEAGWTVQLTVVLTRTLTFAKVEKAKDTPRGFHIFASDDASLLRVNVSTSNRQA